eukprot:627027_1
MDLLSVVAFIMIFSNRWNIIPSPMVWHWNDEIFQAKLFYLLIRFDDHRKLLPDELKQLLPTLRRFVDLNMTDMEFNLPFGKWKGKNRDDSETDDLRDDERFTQLSDLDIIDCVRKLRGTALTATQQRSHAERKNHLKQYILDDNDAQQAVR